MGLGVTLGGMSYQLFLQIRGAMRESFASPEQMRPSFGDSYIVIALIAVCIIPLAILALRESHDPNDAAEPWDMYII